MYTQRSPRRRLSRLLAVPAALALVAAACGDDDGDDGGGSEDTADDTSADTADDTASDDTSDDTSGDTTDDTSDDTTDDTSDDTTDDTADGGSDEGAASGEGGEIGLAWIAWEENIANTNLWAEILEDEGYDVTLQGPLEPGPAFQAIAGGDQDLFLDVWMPTTHGDFMDEVGDDVEELGTWFEGATVELTVPEYVEEINTMEDLAENGDMFDNTITGIESGAGMMQTLNNTVLGAYGMEEDWTVQASSTPAMRQELQTAYDNEEPIVVTLWTPHPEYVDKDLKILEDPEGAWGEGEELQSIARDGFSDEFPEVAEWIENFEMTPDQVGELEAAIEEAGENGERDGARQWIDENQDVVDGWLGN